MEILEILHTFRSVLISKNLPDECADELIGALVSRLCEDKEPESIKEEVKEDPAIWNSKYEDEEEGDVDFRELYNQRKISFEEFNRSQT